MAQASSLPGVFVGAIVVILAGILVYSAAGVVIESSGIAIYDDFPSKPISLSGRPISISVNNNAPMALPYVTPTYVVSVAIISNTSAIECVYPMIGKPDLPCSQMSIDLGRIAQGESKSVSVRIQTNGNFTLRVDVRMRFFTEFQVKSKSISCLISKSSLSYETYHLCSGA